MGDLPRDAARRWGDREALVFGDRRWTHAEFAADVDQVARGLIGIGVEPGDKVGIWMTNRPEWLFLMYAIPAVGAVTVPMNTRYRIEDAQYAVDQSDTSTLVINDRSGPIDWMQIAHDRDVPGKQHVVADIEIDLDVHTTAESHVSAQCDPCRRNDLDTCRGDRYPVRVDGETRAGVEQQKSGSMHNELGRA